MKRIALFAGSFDPFTRGHEDIVLRGLKVFDEIVIAIGYNSQKNTRYFPIDMMLDPSDQNYPFADVEAGRVRPVAGFIVKQSDCAACGKPYRDCPCSRLFDPGCHQVISKAAPISVFLTPRPA